MSDASKGGRAGPASRGPAFRARHRRSGEDRRSGSDRPESRRGIRDLPPFSWLFGRGKDRRRGEDRRRSAGGSGRDPGRDPGYVKATELTTEPIRLQELAEKSGITVERLRRAAFGKEKLSADERAVLTGRDSDEDS